MAEITLRQIADLMDQKFAVQTASMDQKLVAMEERMDQKLVAMEERMEERMDQKLVAMEERVNQRFVEQTELMENSMVQAIESAVAIIQANQEKFKEELKEEIVRSSRVLAENIEGRKIQSLAEESQAHKEILDNHEARITELEAVGRTR